MITPNVIPLNTNLAELQARLALLQALTLNQISGTVITLAPTNIPKRPTSGFKIFVDKTDLKLKAIGSAGTITTIGAP